MYCYLGDSPAQEPECDGHSVYCYCFTFVLLRRVSLDVIKLLNLKTITIRDIRFPRRTFFIKQTKLPVKS